MSDPKLHHYVPRFYLKNFCDPSGRLWVWDKVSRKVYPSSPEKVAAGTYFYRVPEFIGTDVDPLFLEKDLADLEGRAAVIFEEFIPLLDTMKPLQFLQMGGDERWTISSYMAVQFLRTADQRDILEFIALSNGFYKDGITTEEKVNLHAYMLCAGGLIEKISKRIYDSIWMYARNGTKTPFWTSDNPVAFKTADNKMWLKGPGILSKGSYVVFPITPNYVLYCHEREYWSRLEELDTALSPVQLTDEMVQHENAGQVFMATRHLLSRFNEFSWANEFVESIGTDKYAPGWANNDMEPTP
jgi:hypothetical protein